MLVEVFTRPNKSSNIWKQWNCWLPSPKVFEQKQIWPNIGNVIIGWPNMVFKRSNISSNIWKQWNCWLPSPNILTRIKLHPKSVKSIWGDPTWCSNDPTFHPASMLGKYCVNCWIVYRGLKGLFKRSNVSPNISANRFYKCWEKYSNNPTCHPKCYPKFLWRWWFEYSVKELWVEIGNHDQNTNSARFF